MNQKTTVIKNRPRVRRVRGWMVGVLGVLVLLLMGVGPYTNYLWFAEDIRKAQVFTLRYQVEGQLFLVGFLFSWIVFFFSLRQAFRWSVVYTAAPEKPGDVVIARLVEWLQAKGQVLVSLVAPILAIFAGMGFGGGWRDYLMFRHSQSFGVTDPLFGKDLGFFVFQLPWLTDFASSMFGVLFFATFLCALVIFGLQTLATLAKVELSRPQVRTLISVMVGLTMVAWAFKLGLACYLYSYAEGGQFTGAGYAAVQQMRMQAVASGVLLLAGLLAILNAWVGRPYRLAAVGAGAFVIVYLLGVGLWPSFTQWAFVTPNKLSMEAPFADHAIKMTHLGYGLDAIEVKEFNAKEAPSAEEVKAASSTLENMRLWDPRVMQQSIEALQGLRSYYTFRDVDVDRYTINGKQTMVMLSPRDVELGGLTENARTWQNTRLRYTHGFGLTLSPVNTATSQGRPTFLVRDLPPKSVTGLEVTEPRIYFTDVRNEEDELPVMVDTNTPEFDYPAQNGDVSNRWTGDRGIRVGGFLRKLAFSMVLGDMNMLISSNITPDSRLLLTRGVRERATRAYPFLTFDHDPYIVIQKGRLVWILDGYTTTSMVPYSQETVSWLGRLNYIRNSVKVSIDAYSGEMTAYAVLPDEPILKAWRSIYPGLVSDLSAAPKELVAHFRYPEDMFRLQTEQLTQFHVTDPKVFLGNGDAWAIPYQRSLRGERAPIDPYYVQMKLPDEPSDGFILIRPFTPVGKTNMSGWLAAHCDPASYGRLVLYKYPKDTPIAGPEQVESNFIQDPTVARINREFNNDQSQVVVGNLLVVPIGTSVMYVEPLFLQSRVSGITPIPELKKVILGVKDRIVVGDTYAEALAKLFAVGAPVAPVASVPAPSGSVPTRIGVLREELLKILNDADAALRAGDWARYGELQKKLRERIQVVEGGG